MIIRCLLYDDRCSLFAVCCLLLAVCCLWNVVRRVPFIGCRRVRFVVCCVLLLTVTCGLVFSVVRCSLRVAGCCLLFVASSSVAL